MLCVALVLLAAAWFAPHGLGMLLAVAAAAVTAFGAVAALTVLDRRAKAAQATIEGELHAFQALMGDLPELAVAMDREGRAQAVFGQPLPGLPADILHQGLLHLVSGADQAPVKAALDQAATDGHAAVTFTPSDSEVPRISAVLQKTGAGGLTAILRAAPPPQLVRTATAALQSSSQPWAELTQRLSASEAAREAAEAGRRKAEADAAGRARFLANMSHELRTPLNAIMGFSDIMRVRMFGDLGPRYTEYAELIHESGRHLLDLINDVLDMSKIEAQRFDLAREPFDARDAVNAALRLVRLQADEAGVKLRGVLPAEPLEIDADRRAIKQIVLNLVSNALKFTPAGGAVTVTADRAGAEFELLVADTGMGIAPEDLERLGRPYEQAGGADERAKGTGLGLSLVRAFAELHGGRMTLESRLGEGTAVAVRLPVLVGVEPVPEPAPKLPPERPLEPTIAPPPPAEAAASATAPAPLYPKVPPGGVPDAP